LLYALTDPDDRVFREADAGLRFMSRRIGAPPLPEKLSPADRARIAGQWKAWHAGIRPDAGGP
jgi:hypothetical protein